MEEFNIIIVEDVALELKGTEGIIRNDIPEAHILGTADNEPAYWKLIKQQVPDLVLLDLGLGGSTTVGVEICRHTKEMYPNVKVLIFTGEILNEKLWVDVLDAGCDGIILKSGELLTRSDVASVMNGKRLVFNQPILERIVERFKKSVESQILKQEALVNFEIDEYDERFLRHLALGYTKEQITNLRGMPFGVKSLEKRQNELVQKLLNKLHDLLCVPLNFIFLISTTLYPTKNETILRDILYSIDGTTAIANPCFMDSVCCISIISYSCSYWFWRITMVHRYFCQ